MSRQAERSEATRGELLRVARRLFTEPGYEKTSLDMIAAEARVTKGAIYHHFPNKRDLFQAVFESLEEELCGDVITAAASAGGDVWRGLQLGARQFLEAAKDAAVSRIVLIDGPSVLGWEQWREIDDRYGFALTRGSLEAAMKAGLIAQQPLDPLAHIFLAAMSEAAIQIARASDVDKAIEDMSGAITTMMESLRVKK